MTEGEMTIRFPVQRPEWWLGHRHHCNQALYHDSNEPSIYYECLAITPDMHWQMSSPIPVGSVIDIAETTYRIVRADIDVADHVLDLDTCEHEDELEDVLNSADWVLTLDKIEAE